MAPVLGDRKDDYGVNVTRTVGFDGRLRWSRGASFGGHGSEGREEEYPPPQTWLRPIVAPPRKGKLLGGAMAFSEQQRPAVCGRHRGAHTPLAALSETTAGASYGVIEVMKTS